MKKQRLLAVLLTLIMVFSMLPSMALGADGSSIALPPDDANQIGVTNNETCEKYGTPGQNEGVYLYELPQGATEVTFSNVISVYTIVGEDEGGLEWDYYTGTSKTINLATYGEAAQYIADYDTYFNFTNKPDFTEGSYYLFNVTDGDEEDTYNVIVKVPEAGEEPGEENGTLKVTANGCDKIGEYMNGPVYLYSDVPQSATQVEFTDYAPADVAYLMSLTSSYDEETNTAPISASYKVPAAFATSGSFTASEGYEDFDFTGTYLYCIIDQDYKTVSFVLKPAEGEEPSEEAILKATADGEELDIVRIENGYEYTDWNGNDQAVDLYTVAIPPYSIDKVTLNYGENTYVSYDYDAAGTYLDSYGSVSGQSEVDITDLDNYVWVQTPYNTEDWSGGELQYVVNFVPLFTAKINGTETALTDISVEKDGYQYKSYFGEVSTGNLYTITIPVGTEKIDFSFSSNCLAYNYKGEGSNPVVVDDSGPDAFLGGTVSDYNNGYDQYTREVDINKDSVFDYIQIQDGYSLGGGLRYAITFRYIFSAEADGEPLNDITAKESGYTPYVWDNDAYEMVPGEPVTLYTVDVPEGTANVDLTFPENVLAYNYKDGETYLYGNYPDDILSTGVDKVTVPVDYNEDGEPDYIQVQTPYDADYNSTVLYAITFSQAPSAGPEEGITEAELRDNIAARYATSGVADDANAPWLAADMMAYEKIFPDTENKLSEEQKQDMVNKAVADIAKDNASLGDVSKNTIALVAMGYDPAQLTTAKGEEINGKEKLDSLAFDENGSLTAAAKNIYTLPYVLIAYQQFEGQEDQIDQLVQAAVDNKSAWLNAQWGTDGLTPMMLALAPYYDTNEDVKTALDEAVEAVKAAQDDTGAVGNAASTGLAITGLKAMGIDPAEIKKNDKSLIDGLLASVNDTEDGLKPENTSHATEQGFRGLVADAKEGAYRIYDFGAQTLKPAVSEQNAGADFVIVPEDALIEVKDATGATVEPVSATRYDLEPGEYTYAVSKEGYVTKDGSFSITEEDIANHERKEINVSLQKESQGGDGETIKVTVRVLTHDADICNNSFTYKKNADKYTSLLSEDKYVVTLDKATATARDALVAALDANQLSYVEKSNGYFSSIGGYEELDHGPNSGWMYMINNEVPSTAAGATRIKKDSTMVWFYTDDYTKDYGSEKWNNDDSGTPATGDAAVDDVIKKINDIGTVDENSGDKIKEAREAYDKLTPEQQAKVSNYDKLTKAEEDFKAIKEKDHDETCPSKKFTDVDTSAWYHESIDYALEQELFNGTSETTFEPNTPMNRGMLVTVLWRLEGKPASKESSKFADVKADAYYAEAVAWANENGIVNGYDETRFAPEDKITREQMATIFSRYAKQKGYDVSKAADLSAYTDAGEISDYALDGMKWANAEGLITGRTETTLAPKGNSTRAEVATIIKRFMENVAK